MNLLQKTSIALSVSALICSTSIGPCGALTDADQDPAIEVNWMVDRQNQRIRSKSETLANLKKQQSVFEKLIAEDRKFSRSSTVAAVNKLLPIYKALALKKNADRLTHELETKWFEKFDYTLQNFYLQGDDKAQLVRILARSYSMQKPKADAMGICAQLDRIADLYYQLGNMQAAEKYYKLAVDHSRKDLAVVSRSKDTLISVQIGALYSYACFLAAQGKLKEATPLVENIMT